MATRVRDAKPESIGMRVRLFFAATVLVVAGVLLVAKVAFYFAIWRADGIDRTLIEARSDALSLMILLVLASLAVLSVRDLRKWPASKRG